MYWNVYIHTHKCIYTSTPQSVRTVPRVRLKERQLNACVAAHCNVSCSVLQCVETKRGLVFDSRSDNWICVLQYVAVYSTLLLCNVLQQTATDCNRLQQTATDCDRLQQTDEHTATNYNTLIHAPSTLSCTSNILQHTATHYNTLQHTTTHWYTHPVLYHARAHHLPNLLHQHAATRCNPLQHAATHCNTLQRMQQSATHCNERPVLSHARVLHLCIKDRCDQ